jgi:DHA2 family multidrug resistance protein
MSATTAVPVALARQGAQTPAARPQVNKWLVTLSITFGTLMGAIDASIVNVALPHIRGSVGATIEEITWISSGFALANVVVMPLTAFLGRLFGQKRVYMACLVLFLLGSTLCGMARSLPALVIYRVLQGLGAGALQPTEQAILRQTFPPREQGMAMALFSIAVMIGPAIGPTLGGFIVDHYSWPMIFYINLPIGLLGLAMVASFVHEDPEIAAKNRELAEAQRKHVDWSGIALLSVGLSTLQYALEEGPRNDWFTSRAVSTCAAVAVIGLIAFVIRELTAKVPAVNIRLFKDQAFASGTLIGGLMFCMLMANMFLLPLFMQELLGFTATQAGMALMPRVLVMMVATPIVGRLYNHVDPRIVVGIGVLIYCYGAYDMSHLTLGSGQHDVVFAIMIQGVGFACLFVPLTTTALSSIPRHLLPDATGLNALFRQIGGSVGLAVFASLISTYTMDARSSIVAHLAPTRPELQERVAMMAKAFAARGLDPGSAHTAALAALSGQVQRQAAALAFDKLFLLAGIVFLAVLPLLAFLKVNRGNSMAPPSSEISVHE